MTEGYYTCSAKRCLWVGTWSLSFVKGNWLHQLDLIMTAMINSLDVLALFISQEPEQGNWFYTFVEGKELKFLSFLITNLSPDNLKVRSNCKSWWLSYSPKSRCLLGRRILIREWEASFSSFIFTMNFARGIAL